MITGSTKYESQITKKYKQEGNLKLETFKNCNDYSKLFFQSSGYFFQPKEDINLRKHKLISAIKNIDKCEPNKKRIA